MQDPRLQQSPYGSLAAAEVSPLDPKPRLRWTPELHERFVDAVTQLGGPESEFSMDVVVFNLSHHLCLCLVDFEMHSIV